MDYLTLAEITEHTLPEADVEIAAWGGTVRVRALTSHEFARCQRRAADTRTGDIDGFRLNVLVVVTGAVEPSMPITAEAQLMRMEPGPIAKMAETIMDLSGIGEEEPDLEALGEA